MDTFYGYKRLLFEEIAVAIIVIGLQILMNWIREEIC